MSLPFAFGSLKASGIFQNQKNKSLLFELGILLATSAFTYASYWYYVLEDRGNDRISRKKNHGKEEINEKEKEDWNRLEEEILQLQEEKKTLKYRLKQMERNRQDDRQGRISAEKKLREVMLMLSRKNNEQAKTIEYEDNGFLAINGSRSSSSLEEIGDLNVLVIGKIFTPFKDRFGTPRQGNLAFHAKGVIKLESCLNYTAFEGLESYSHLWVIFLFHENTDLQYGTINSQNFLPAGKNGELQTKEGEVNGKKQNQRVKTLTCKIRPPRLKGKKVGVFSTRSPHRPNPIGMSLVTLDKIENGYLYVSGVDLLNQTPIIDIKPYVPNDIATNPNIPRYPDWVAEEETLLNKKIIVNEIASRNIHQSIENDQLLYYTTYEDYVAFLEEVLIQDIRSNYQGRGKGSKDLPLKVEKEKNSSPVSLPSGEMEYQEYKCRLDQMLLTIIYKPESIHIIDAIYQPT